jgi:hypothetical protein
MQLASWFLLVTGWLLVYVFALGKSESKHTRPTPVKYQYDTPKDWAEDSTVSESKKEYCEYVYTKEIEEWKRNKQQ